MTRKQALLTQREQEGEWKGRRFQRLPLAPRSSQPLSRGT